MYIVYGKNHCQYCVRAKSLLDRLAIEYEYRDVSDPAILSDLKERVPTVKTVPQIFDNEKLIGGYDDLFQFLNQK